MGAAFCVISHVHVHPRAAWGPDEGIGPREAPPARVALEVVAATPIGESPVRCTSALPAATCPQPQMSVPPDRPSGSSRSSCRPVSDRRERETRGAAVRSPAGPRRRRQSCRPRPSARSGWLCRLARPCPRRARRGRDSRRPGCASRSRRPGRGRRRRRRRGRRAGRRPAPDRGAAPLAVAPASPASTRSSRTDLTLPSIVTWTSRAGPRPRRPPRADGATKSTKPRCVSSEVSTRPRQPIRRTTRRLRDRPRRASGS